MLNTITDKRVVLSLDAGGTNFVFSAIQGTRDLTEPITLPAHSNNLELCLQTTVEGFKQLKENIGLPVDAISFAFPGPADYNNGIIGDLPNFAAFKDGVALGPMLEDIFQVPVFINNDGNLFAYGEALSGFIPVLNQRLEKQGSIKRCHNLIGITLGTGFGCGIVLEQKLLRGDTSCGAEIHNTLNKFNPDWNAEESVSTRAIQRVYAEVSKTEFNSNLKPKDIYHIAKGIRPGNAPAAVEAFRQYGEALGSSIANVVTLVDGVVVLGGGITASWDLFSQPMFMELNRQYQTFRGEKTNRLSFRVFNLEDEAAFPDFANGKVSEIEIPGSNRKIKFDSMPRTGVGLSRLGASKATMLGAYAYALQELDSK